MVSNKVVSAEKELLRALDDNYSKVAGRLARLIPSNAGTVVELGSGAGQLTIPLARRLVNHRIIAIDTYAGPYSRDHGALLTRLADEKLKGRIQVVKREVFTWIRDLDPASQQAIISSELLPELDSPHMKALFKQCHRVLEPGGISVHCFLSPKPRNLGQHLVIEADSNPQWTRSPPREWFSPPPSVAVKAMREAGFGGVRLITIRSNLTIRSTAAESILRRWGVKRAFWHRYKSYLTKNGLVLPDWMLLFGLRPPI